MRVLCAALILALLPVCAEGQPLTTAFTYQGEVRTDGNPVSGPVDLRFRLFDAALGGNQVGSQLCVDNLSAEAGRFTVALDFGPGAFAGQRRWLEIDARPDTGLGCGSVAGFTTLSPRQEVTAATQSVFALAAQSSTQLGGQPGAFYQNATNLNAGVLPGARLSGSYVNQLTLSNPLNQISGVYSGSGANLTGLSASNLSVGTVADGLLSANVARRNVANTFTGVSNTFNNSAYFLDRIGIGTAAPERLLHIVDGSAGLVTPSANAMAVIERDQNAYLNFLTPSTALAGILFGSPANEADGGVLYDHGFRSLQFRTGGNVTRAVISPLGNLGIGTTVPETLLHVQSSADVTTSGSGILTLGNYPAGTFMNADGNEIQVFNGNAPADLFLNALGGRVAIGGSGVPQADLDVSGTFRAFSGAFANTLSAAGVVSSGDAGLEPRFVAGAFAAGDSRLKLNSSADRYCRLELTEDSATGLGGWIEYDGIHNWLSFGTLNNTFGEAFRINRGSDNVQFFGSISKAGGSFQIDHPLDPENKFLFHSFVESPDMMNVYNGNVTTDAAGYAVVTLPDWFEALNDEFRYQVTIIDDAAPDVCFARVVRKIGSDAPNRFTVKTTPGNIEVSWQVTGVRKDAWARSNRIPVEVAKTGEERGKYLHPAAFGLPADRSIPVHRAQAEQAE